MPEQTTYNPYSLGADRKVPAQVDRADVINTDRRNARTAFPNLMKVVELATGLFGRLEGRFVGLDPDGHRVENLVVAAGSSLTNTLTGLLSEAEEASELIQGVISKMDLSRKDVQNVNDWLKTKLDAIVNRYQGSIAASAEELEDFAQAVISRLDAVKSPIDRMSILYLAYNYAAQAVQTLAVVGDPPRINGPSTFISLNAAIAADAQYIIPCTLYGRYQFDITWYTAGTTLLQFNVYGKYNDAAWLAVTTNPPGQLQNTKFQTIAGVPFGAPPVGGGAAGATANILCARMQDPDGFNSLCVEMISINRDANNVVVTGTYRLQGGTA